MDAVDSRKNEKKNQKNQIQGKSQTSQKNVNQSKIEFQGLKKVLFFCVGASVFLTKNLKNDLGLFNSSPGVIKEIYYPNGSDPTRDLPEYVLVEFENFRGPRTDGKKLFPVRPVTIVSDDFLTYRRQIPLELSYAINVVRAQSKTIPKIVVSLSKPEMAVGETYVAISRTIGLNCVAIKRMHPSRLLAAHA